MLWMDPMCLSSMVTILSISEVRVLEMIPVGFLNSIDHNCLLTHLNAWWSSCCSFKFQICRRFKIFEILKVHSREFKFKCSGDFGWSKWLKVSWMTHGMYWRTWRLTWWIPDVNKERLSKVLILDIFWSEHWYDWGENTALLVDEGNWIN